LKLVVDASVALKWFFQDPEREADIDRADVILNGFVAGDIALFAPVHFQVEVCAVLARQSAPGAMLQHLSRLEDLSIPVCDHASVVARAMSLSLELEHHLFDTLYHAVALEEDALLITADHRYWAKACDVGGIAELAGWESISHR